MKAVALLSETVQNNYNDAKIAALERLIDASAIERREAVDSYRAHLLSHSQRAWAAGAE